LYNEFFPPEGKKQLLTSLRFQSWQAAEQFLLNKGAKPEVLRETQKTLKATSLAVLTITPPEIPKVLDFKGKRILK
jgi:hypothetical protein